MLAKAVAASCSKLLNWDVKSQRDPTWSYRQCFMIASPIVHGRRRQWLTKSHNWSWNWSCHLSYAINIGGVTISSPPIVSNRTLTRTTNRGERLEMEIVGQFVTGRTTDRATVWDTITHDWWCDHTRLVVRPYKTFLRLVIGALKFYTWPSTFLRQILLVRSPTITTISGTLYLRFDSDSNIYLIYDISRVIYTSFRQFIHNKHAYY